MLGRGAVRGGWTWQQRRWKSVRIGCASGFWGDTSVSTRQLVEGTPSCDYIVHDFLSEITMSLLARAKVKDPQRGGFCPDFLTAHIAPNLEQIKSKGIKIVANAGGLNPQGCADALRELAASRGVELRVAAVLGDEVTGKSVGSPDRRYVSRNAYLGAAGIQSALMAGADVVVTGRVVDSALALGPLAAEFGWDLNGGGDLDLLALGSLAGHLIECGGQATGGVATDWAETADSWHNIGASQVINAVLGVLELCSI